MAEPIIRVENISKAFRLGVLGAGSLREDVASWWYQMRNKGARRELASDFWALQDLSFEVKPGEVVGIVGHNGAGKSTLLKILSRITEPTSGRIVMNGRVGSLLEVGTGFHPELTGRENVYLNGAILGMSRKEVDRKFDEIVEFAECARFIDTPVKRYSSGMRVRVAFAVAAHLEPEILVIDEVLAVGDAAFQEKCIGKMESVAEEGRTILFVSHNMGTIRQLCQRAIVLQNGRVTADGDASEAVSQYLQDMEKGVNEAFSENNPKRKLRGKARFTDLLILSKEGLPVQDLIAGETVHFDLSFESGGEPIHSIRLDIWNDFGVVATQLSTRFLEMGTIDQERGTLRFTIESLPLTRGRYRISAVCHCHEDLSDLVPNAAVFSVSGGSIHSSGISPPSGRCTTMIPFTCGMQAVRSLSGV
ncbi:ABC transporter ATP-binding protein [Pelagicoccus sp. SDUM812002]|uniref:ABC transporter ATP-binding protein n=1 Tax=Pelagicoccus sp. SDUM812002 TaxID=3041266 RepID=UPI00280F62B8|nr:ABC transporter ATP-binding protein [Pelagicoccus sp. SDUM812002]MDQ8184959.1 ABC transporter ATP-binding protein [Pelagicoccus sp. SDUM812002]